MVSTAEIQTLIHDSASAQQLLRASQAAGQRSMREDGERLVRAGVTSPEEVIRVTRD